MTAPIRLLHVLACLVPAIGLQAQDDIEEVVVTGSRIILSDTRTPSPVMVFDAEALADAGVTTLAEFARYLPQTADVLSDSRSSLTGQLGSAGFNLRGLGLDATLTLVNGRRIAPFGFTGEETPFVDLNALPMAAIERIEVLKDGASAIYGSEAVAGVVNIITLRQIDGVHAEGGYLTTVEGDGAEWDVSLAGGWTGESTAITGTLSYLDRDAILKRDRDYSRDVDRSAQGGYVGRSTFSSPPSLGLLDSGLLLADPACPDSGPINSRIALIPDALEFCLFNFAWFMTQQNPAERLGLTASLEHEWDTGLVLFAELLLSRNETMATLAPAPLSGFTVPADHPANPFAENLSLRGRALDAGNRETEMDATTGRALIGLRGRRDAWAWEAALMYSEAEADRARNNAILTEPFQQALRGFGGPAGDQFYNPFGLAPGNPAEVIDSFRISGVHHVKTTRESTADFQLSGTFGRLGGGPVSAAFGGQLRRLSFEQVADEEELNGLILGSRSFEPLDEERDVSSVFAEFLLPLHEKLDLQAAVRLDDYSDFGSTTNPKIGLAWRVNRDLTLRTTWGTSFRPPTFNELYAPTVQSFGFVFDRPHRCPASGDPLDCFGRMIEFEFSGNPELEPDEGEHFYLGAVWQPAFLAGLSVGLDLWQIEHSQRVFNSRGFPIANIIYERLDPFDNPFVIRAPQTPEDQALGIPGVAVRRVDTYVNGDTLETNGVDLELAWKRQTAGRGDFSASLKYSYLNEYLLGTDFREVSFAEDLAGRTVGFNALPRYRASLVLGWERNASGLSALVSYAGDYRSPVNWVVDGRESDRPFIVDDYTRMDIQYRHTFERLRNGMLRVGCRNCTDADPPTYNHGDDASLEAFHDGRGLSFYVRWSQPF